MKPLLPAVLATSLWLFIVLPACSKKDSPSNNVVDRSLLPLAVGAQWVYSNTAFGIVGVATQDTLTFSGPVRYQGRDYFVPGSDRVAILPTTGVVPMRADDSCLFQYDLTTGEETLLFKKVAVTDTLVERSFALLAGQPSTGSYYHVAYSEPEMIDSFACYKNEYYSIDSVNHFASKQVLYISPGVGIIRKEIYGDRYPWMPTLDLYPAGISVLVAFKR